MGDGGFSETGMGGRGREERTEYPRSRSHPLICTISTSLGRYPVRRRSSSARNPICVELSSPMTSCPESVNAPTVGVGTRGNAVGLTL